MRRAVLALLGVLAFAGAGWAQGGEPGVSAADRAAIQTVIARQIEAFQRDDAPGAFAFAAPGIQDQFGDADRFLGMVRRAYPPVHRPRSVDFTELLVGEEVVQQVELIGPEGEAALALYTMMRDDTGRWRIAGCSLVRSARAGA